MKKPMMTMTILCMFLSACTSSTGLIVTSDSAVSEYETGVTVDEAGVTVPQLNQYRQYLMEMDSSITDLEEMFYMEIDADRDGYKEVIAAYGENECIGSSYVLRDKEGVIQLVKQDFHTEAYSARSIQLAQFTGSDRYYIIVDVTNYGNMKGLGIYDVNDSDVIRIAGASSPSGRGLAHLSDRQSDGTYGGFTVHRDSWETFYYDTSVFYQFREGSFVPLQEEIKVGDYPDDPAGVVIQYLSMYLLYQRYEPDDVFIRILQLRDSWVYFYLDEPAWALRIRNYMMGIDAEEAPGLAVEEKIEGDTAVVTIRRTGGNINEVHHVDFCLSLHDAKWQITDIIEAVEIKTEAASLWVETLDINQTYEGKVGFAEINLRLPQLSGEHGGIAEINRYYSKDEYLFDHFGFAGMVDDEDMPSDTMKGRGSNHHFSAYYCFTAQKGNLISFMAYTDGGAGGIAWNGMRGDTFDLTTGKRLSLSDLFCVSEEEYLEVVYNLIAEQASVNINESMIRNSAGPYWFSDAYSEDGMNRIKTLGMNDFYLAEDALVFFYPKYQLAAGGAGGQEFSIPYDQMSDILTPGLSKSD